jgi:hypothetical protein
MVDLTRAIESNSEGLAKNATPARLTIGLIPQAVRPTPGFQRDAPLTVRTWRGAYGERASLTSPEQQ